MFRSPVNRIFVRSVVQSFRVQAGQTTIAKSLGTLSQFGHKAQKSTVWNMKPTRPMTFVQQRTFSSTTPSDQIDSDFKQAQADLSKITVDIENEDKLSMYALYKQAQNGACNTKKPSMMNLVEKAKWQAWNDLGDISGDEAKKRYIEIVNRLRQASGNAEGSTDGAKIVEPAEPVILIEKKDRVCWITLNRPKQMNAVSTEMIVKWTEALESAAKDPEVRFTVVIGNGQYFSSGNDLKNFEKSLAEYKGDLEKASKAGAKICQNLVDTVIDFPKPLIGAVNGPALGISFTILGLFDTVICSDRAIFKAPFSALGISPEGCSTSQFPKIFGTSLASELLYYNYQLSAEEALRLGFVSRIIPVDQFQSHLEQWLYDPKKGLVNTCYPNSMNNAKALVRNDTERARLREVNQRECDVLVQSFLSEECMQAIQKFFMQKSSK